MQQVKSDNEDNILSLQSKQADTESILQRSIEIQQENVEVKAELKQKQ